MRKNSIKYLSSSSEETIAFGKELAKSLLPNSVVLFSGDLGAGKTTLIKGLVSAATGTSIDEVNSPTYVYLNIYDGKVPVYHFDLYRLNGPDEFLAMGFEEYFTMNGLSLVEWSERIEQILPKDFVKITIEHAGNDKRLIDVSLS